MDISIPIPPPQTIIAFVLIMARIGAAMALAPVFSSRTVPTRIKVIIAIFIALLLIPIIHVPANLAQASMVMLIGLMIKEVVVGLAIGLAIGAVVAAWQLGGAVLDLMTGFSYGGVLEPQYGNQTGLLAQMYALLAMALFLVLQGPEWLIGTIAQSFKDIPLNGSVPAGDYVTLATDVMASVFITGLGVIAPIFIALLLTDVTFGLVARAAPATQILQIEFPLKIAVALVIMTISLPMMVPVFTNALESAVRLIGGG